MYDKVPNNMNFVEREVQVEKYWKDNDIFGKSIKAREGAPVFTFYDGPPTANGKPHIGHIIQTQCLFYLQFNRQTVCIPAGLSQNLVALHGFVTGN